MKSFIKSTLGFKGKKKSESDLIPSKRNFKFDEISANTLIDLLDANVRKKTADKSRGGIQLNTSPIVGTMVDAFMEGTLTKDVFLKHDASTLWSVAMKILETCNPILTHENCSNLRNATPLQVTTITDALPLHQQQILGALFAAAEILIQSDDTCAEVVSSSLSNALLWPLTPDSSETSESFVNLVSNHRQNLPYCFTFSRKVGSAHDEIPSDKWTEILSRRTSTANSSAVPAVYLPVVDISSPQSKAGLYKDQPVQRSLQLNVVDQDGHTPSSSSAVKLAKLSGEVEEVSRSRKLSDSSIVLAGSSTAKSNDSWANAKSGGSSSTNTSQDKKRFVAAPEPASDSEEEEDQKEDDSIVSLRDLQEVFASSLVSAASLEYLNVRELKEDDYADVKTLVRNVKWTLSHSELAAAVGDANKNVKESLKGILAWNDFLTLADPYLHKTDRRFLKTNSVRYDQQYKRPDPAAAKKGTATTAAAAASASGGAQSKSTSQKRSGNDSGSDSDESSDDKQRSVRTTGQKPAAEVKKGGRNNTDVSYEEETLDEIVMSNSPARTNKSKGGSSSSSGAGGRGRYSDHSDEEEEGGRRDFKRDNGVSQRNAAARAVLRSVVDQDDSDEDRQSIPDISETHPTGGGGRAEVSYGRNVSSSTNNRGSAVASRLAPSSSRAAPLASSLVSDHSFDRESENSSDREGEDGDDIPTLDQEEDRRNQSQSQLNNSWDEESMRQDPHGRQGLDQSVEQDSNVMSLLRGDDKQEEEEEEDEFGDARPSTTANTASAAAAPVAMTKRRQPQVSMFSLTELDRSTTSFDGDGERGSERLQLDTSHTAATAEEPNALLQSVNLNSPGQQSVGSQAFSNPQGDTEGGQPGPKKKKGLMSKFKAALRLKGGKKGDGEGGVAAEEGGLGGRIRSMSTNSMNSVGTDEGSFDVSTHNNTAPGVQGGSPAVDEGKKKSMFSVLGFGRRPSAPSSPATNAAAAGAGAVPADTTASAGIASTKAVAAPPHQSSITMRQEAEDRERRSRSSTPTIPDAPPAAAAAVAAAAAAAQQTTSAVVSSAPTSHGVAASMVPSVPDPSAANPGAPSASAAAAATKPKSKWFAASSAATSKNQGGNTSITAGSAAPSSSAAAAAADAPSIAELASSYSTAVASHSPAPHHGRVKRAHSSSEVLQTTNNSTAAAGGAAAAPLDLRHSSSVPTLEVNPASSGVGPESAAAASSDSVSASTNKLSNPAPKRTLSGIFSAPFRSKPTRSHSIDLGSPSGAAAAAGASAEGSPAAAAPSPENRRPSLFGSLLRRSNSNNSMTGGPTSAQGTPTGGLRKTPSASQVSIRGNGLGLASLLRGPVSGSNAGSPAHPHGDSTPHSPSAAAAAHHHKHLKKKHTLTVATEVTAVMKLQKALQKSKELHEYIESNSGTAMYHHKKTSTAAAVAADSTSGESKGKTNQFGFEIPTGGKPPKLDLLEEMKLIQRNAANHELRSFDAKLFQADDGFRSHHHTMEPDEEYLQEVHRAWDQIAKRREPLNMIVSAQDIELMKYLTKLFEKPAPPDPEVVAAHKVEARLRSTTSVLYPRFGEFVHSTHPVVPRASLVPDENLLKRQLSSHHSISTSTTNHSQIDLALAVKHGGQLLKCVSTRRGAFRKRYFTILVEPWVNPNLGGITPIIDAQNTTMATPPALQDDGGVAAAAAAASGAEIDNMCDYYLQEYERSVTSKWGVLPLRLKQTYSLGKMISIVTDSSAAKKGREFSITFKLNKRINRSGVVSAQEVEANRLAAAAAEAEEEEDENGDGGSVSSGGGGSEVSGGDHSSDEEEEEGSDKEEGEEEEEVAMDREELKRRKSKRGKSVRLAVDQAALPSTGTAAGAKGNKKGEESKTDSTVNQITQLNSSEGDPGTAAASGDTAANAANVVLDHVDTKKQKKMKKKDRNIVTLRLRADTSDERLLWIKMLLAVGTSDVYVNTVRRCNRMNTSIGGTPFNVLLEQAASLKTAQLASSRTKYDSFDIWYQHSLYSRQDIIQIRNAGEFSEMIAFASDCKMLGNSLYEKLDYSSAIHQYERALSVFKWIEPLDPDWKSKGIDDETQRECVYQCKSDPELQLVKQLNLSCLLNLSICYLKSNEFKNCISACNAILALSPDNAKAYYRRAQAKLIPQSTGMVEHQEALKDMQMASSLQPNNASIKKEYLELRESLKAQMEKDKKTFNNLFDRVDYAAADNTDGTVASSSSSSGSSSAQPAPALSYAEVLTRLKDLESAALSYERDGNKQAAADARRRITAIHGLLEQAKKEQREQQQREKGKGVSEAVDYSEPSEKMVEEAAAQGIDLKDERVKKLMMEMERLRVQQQQANSTANKVDPNQLYREAMRGIHLDESKQLADKVLEGLTRNQLVDMLVSRSTFTFHANNNTGSSSSGAGGSADVEAVVQSVSNVIGAYSPDKLYAELHDMIVQDVMSVKTRDDTEDNKEDNNERITDEIMKLLEVRYFNGGGGKRRKSGEKKPWWRTPSVIGIMAGLLFLIISVLLMPRSRSSVADGE